MSGFPDELMDALLVQSAVCPRSLARFARWLGLGCWTPESSAEQTALAQRVIARREDSPADSQGHRVTQRPGDSRVAGAGRQGSDEWRATDEADGTAGGMVSGNAARPAGVIRDGRPHYLPGVAA